MSAGAPRAARPTGPCKENLHRGSHTEVRPRPGQGGSEGVRQHPHPVLPGTAGFSTAGRKLSSFYQTVPVVATEPVPSKQCYRRPRRVCQTVVSTKPKGAANNYKTIFTDKSHGAESPSFAVVLNWQLM